MNRRVLALPLVVLGALILLLAALTSTGGIPSSVATPLISGVIAAMLTGGLALLGIWMNIRYQIDRDRLERLRQAYVQILHAGEKLLVLMEEVYAFPDGRLFPEPHAPTIGGAGASRSQLDAGKRVLDGQGIIASALDEIFDLQVQAEATIYLDQGENSALLQAWRAAWQSYTSWRDAFRAIKMRDEASIVSLDHEAREAVEKMRAEALRDLRRLSGR